MSSAQRTTGDALNGGALHGRVALVTGSSRGIGAATAELFAAHGASVALHGRDATALERVRLRITAAGGRAVTVTGDVTRFAEVEAVRTRVENELGPIDVLVANAGGSTARPTPVEDITEEQWHSDLNGNLTATFLTVKAILPGMKARGSGAIITLSSAAARRADAGTLLAYAAAKAGIEVLTKDVAAQAGPYGVRVNCIAPEIILTDRNQQQIPQPVREQLVSRHPLRRLGTPDDVADAALFLASERSAWVTGVVLDVAGGSVLV